jgi:hypothetical protein
MSTAYRRCMGTSGSYTPRRAISVDDELWRAYGDVVGDGGRSDDLREYMTWRVEHPDEPLPGRFRGPVKKVRRRGDSES